MPGSTLGADNIAENKSEKHPCPDEAYIQVGGVIDINK